MLVRWREFREFLWKGYNEPKRRSFDCMEAVTSSEHEGAMKLGQCNGPIK